MIFPGFNPSVSPRAVSWKRPALPILCAVPLIALVSYAGATGARGLLNARPSRVTSASVGAGTNEVASGERFAQLAPRGRHPLENRGHAY